MPSLRRRCRALQHPPAAASDTRPSASHASPRSACRSMPHHRYAAWRSAPPRPTPCRAGSIKHGSAVADADRAGPGTCSSASKMPGASPARASLWARSPTRRATLSSARARPAAFASSATSATPVRPRIQSRPQNARSYALTGLRRPREHDRCPHATHTSSGQHQRPGPERRHRAGHADVHGPGCTPPPAERTVRGALAPPRPGSYACVRLLIDGRMASQRCSGIRPGTVRTRAATRKLQWMQTLMVPPTPKLPLLPTLPTLVRGRPPRRRGVGREAGGYSWAASRTRRPIDGAVGAVGPGERRRARSQISWTWSYRPALGRQCERQ